MSVGIIISNSLLFIRLLCLYKIVLLFLTNFVEKLLLPVNCGLQSTMSIWFSKLCHYAKFHGKKHISSTAWKVSVFGVFLVCISPHSDWGDPDIMDSPFLILLIIWTYIKNLINPFHSTGIFYTHWNNQFQKCTAQKMKLSIKDFFHKYDQIRRKLRIWSHVLKKSFMENFIFCAVVLWGFQGS